jgi:hypothetical protein
MRHFDNFALIQLFAIHNTICQLFHVEFIYIIFIPFALSAYPSPRWFARVAPGTAFVADKSYHEPWCSGTRAMSGRAITRSRAATM